MALQSDEADLVAAWRALAGQRAAPGWSSIPVGPPAGRFRAGVMHPGNAEALLVGFGQIRRPSLAQLPKGRGFAVTALEPGTDAARPYWLVLCREAAGSRELFARMAVDVVRAVSAADEAEEAAVFQLFLSRIRAWQNFMQRPDDGLLDRESQIGLIGELITLEEILNHLPDPVAVVDAWQGPLDGVQDFALGHGAIEVKATTSPTGFPAKISSLEQLDQTVRSPVILAAIRLNTLAAGLTLPGWIDRLRARLGVGPSRAPFENRLLQAGYSDGNQDAYTVAFGSGGAHLMVLDEAFPCLVRSTVPAAILRATYEIDLDQTSAQVIAWDEALRRVGAI